jgi:hypothetical protein
MKIWLLIRHFDAYQICYSYIVLFHLSIYMYETLQLNAKEARDVN